MLMGHKVRIYPNNVQETYLKKACGTARFAYNWALDKWMEEHSAMPELKALKEVREADYNPEKNKPRRQAKKERREAIEKAEGELRAALRRRNEKVKEGEYRKELNGIKKDKYPWMYEVTKCAVQLAIRNDFASAFNHFTGKEGFGFPKFKKKGRNDSFRIDYTALTGLSEINQGYKRLKIPNLEKPLKMAEALRFKGKIFAVAISRRADEWYAAFTIDAEIPDTQRANFGDDNQVTGVDLGVRVLATLSDGTAIAGSKATRQYAKQLTRAQKSLSRKTGSKKDEEKSKNYIKQRKKVAGIHKKIVYARVDALHKMTALLTSNYSVIAIEDLNIKGMLSNHKLAKHIADGAFYEFKRQMLYKSRKTGSKIILADRFFPSSKICNVCDTKYDELKLSETEWQCQICGTVHDRDINAALNLKKLALANNC
jgi:putative transposase